MRTNSSPCHLLVLAVLAVSPTAAKGQVDMPPSCSSAPAQSLICSLARMQALQNTIRTMRASRALQAIGGFLPRLQVAVAEDVHGDTLIAAATARSDTAEAIRLIRDRARMDVRLLATLDTLNALQIEAGLGTVSQDAVNLMAQRLREDGMLTTLIDSVARARSP